MEYHLLNSYLKFQKDQRAPFHKIIKRIPIPIILFLIIAMACLVASVIILFTMGVNFWFYICSIAEAVFAFILCFAQDHWEIKHSYERYTDFKKRAQDLYNWLDQYNIRTKDEIEVIQLRLTNDLEKNEKSKRQNSEKADKWMQTLVIPMILAIVTALISNQTDIQIVISYVFSLLAVLGMIYGIVWMVRSVSGIFDDMRRSNIKLFIKDLQSVIDVKFVFKDKE
jgi:hypothetical protein